MEFHRPFDTRRLRNEPPLAEIHQSPSAVLKIDFTTHCFILQRLHLGEEGPQLHAACIFFFKCHFFAAHLTLVDYTIIPFPLASTPPPLLIHPFVRPIPSVR